MLTSMTRASAQSAAATATATATSPTRMACNAALEALLADSPGVVAAVAGTADGRVYAQASQNGHDVQGARVAAVASSLLALSESFSSEALGSQAEYNSIATARGTIVIVRVPTRARAHVLCLWADKSENFAMTLRLALDGAGQLARLIDAH